ncbi:MAG: hypothetical protein GX376_07105, partial [Firmicutes bacterium]|nr:hypothetical protein [Bacillota bacterium]
EITESSPISILGLTPPTGLSRTAENHKVAVTVVNDDGAAVIADEQFEYIFPPAGMTMKINRVYPGNILAFNENPVTIEGVGFQAGLDILVGYDKVAADGCTIYDSRGDIVAEAGDGLGVLIEFLTPKLSPGTYDVTVVNPDTSLARAPGALTANLRETRPEISQIIPARGPNIGSEVDIIGYDFREGAVVYFGNELAEVIEMKNIDEELGVITVQTPPQAPGKKDVLLVNPDGASCSKKKAFEYLYHQDSIPRIRAIYPPLGDVAGGTRLQIFGQDFYGGGNGEVEVYVGYKRAAQNLEVKDIDNNGYGKEISVLTPPNEAGTYDIKVYNPDGAYFILKEAFTYKEIKDYPTITALEPSVGPVAGDIWVTIEGSGFKEGMEVFFADREAKEIIIQNPNRMRVKVPRGEGPGLVDLIVINADGGSAILEEGFEYVSISPEDAPRIDKVTPSVGRTTGSTRVTISGSNFQEGAVIFFGSQPAVEVEVDSKNRIFAVTPPQGVGVVDVSITNPDGGYDLLPRGFSYIEKDGPLVRGVTPSSGDTGGGIRVVVSGENFDEGAQVYFDSERATSIAQEEGRLIVETTPQDPGPADVTVVNPDGTEGTLAAAFTYFGPPRPPRDLEVQTIDDNTILLSWDPVVGARGYEIYGRRYRDDDMEFMGATPETHYYVTGLRRDTRYYFEIRAVNEYGISTAVKELGGRTSDKGGSGTSWWYSGDDGLHLEGDGLTVLLKEAGYGSRRVYNLDLRDAVYDKVKKYIINIPAAAVERTGKLLVETRQLRLEFPLSVFERAGLRNLTYRERQESYGRIILEKIDGWEGDILQSLLPQGTRPLSVPYRLIGELQLGREVKELSSFQPRVQLSFTWPGSIPVAGEKTGLYYYDPARDSWREETSYASRYSRQVLGEVNKPGIYRALAQKLN